MITDLTLQLEHGGTVEIVATPGHPIEINTRGFVHLADLVDAIRSLYVEVEA